MAAPVLVAPKIDEGEALLKALDQTPVQPFAAFWLWDAEAEEWRLVIGSDLVDHAGPTATLETIQKVLRELSPAGAIELREILVCGRRDRRLELLRGLPQAGRASWTRPLHVSGAVVGGQLVEGAYIYRNSPATVEADEVVTRATEQATALLRKGQIPRLVEIGREQNTALRRAGITGDTLVIAAPVGPGPSFVAPGEPYPVSVGRRVELRIKRTDRADWLQVAA